MGGAQADAEAWPREWPGVGQGVWPGSGRYYQVWQDEIPSSDDVDGSEWQN